MNATRRLDRRSGFSLVLLIAGVLCGAMIGGCGPDVEDMRAEGIQQYRNHQYIQSMATMRHVLELQPSDARANYYMGLNYRTLAARKLREGNPAAAYRELDTAIMYFTQAITSWPNYLEAIASKNEALEARGKYAEALELAQNVAENNRGDAADHFVYLGNEYRDRGDWDNALRSYKTALATEPNHAGAYAAMGELYRRIGDEALAEDSLRRARELESRRSGGTEEVEQVAPAETTYPAAHQSVP